MERNTPQTKCGPSVKVNKSLGGTLHRVWAISEGEREREREQGCTSKYDMVRCYRLGNFIG